MLVLEVAADVSLLPVPADELGDDERRRPTPRPRPNAIREVAVAAANTNRAELPGLDDDEDDITAVAECS